MLQASHIPNIRPISVFLVSDAAAENLQLVKRPPDVWHYPVMEAIAKARASKLARLASYTNQQGSSGHQNGAVTCSQQQAHAAAEPGPNSSLQVARHDTDNPDATCTTTSAAECNGNMQPASDVSSEAPLHSARAAGEAGCSVESTNDPWQPYWVPDKVLEDRADVIDVVMPGSRKCNCFTKSYSQYAKGTGSLLATVADPSAIDPAWTLINGASLVYGDTPCIQAVDEQSCHGTVAQDKRSGDDPAHSDSRQHSSCQADCADGVSDGVPDASMMSLKQRLELAEAWKKLRLRYFTPREVANLHSFPSQFSFPPQVTLRQRYQLLGNSLSVAVVADLLAYMLQDTVIVS